MGEERGEDHEGKREGRGHRGKRERRAIVVRERGGSKGRGSIRGRERGQISMGRGKDLK